MSGKLVNQYKNLVKLSYVQILTKIGLSLIDRD
jgi:hypothetical protein